MLAHLLAIAVAGGSLSFYLALLLVPRIYRHPADFGWSGLGLFYALVLWVCAGRLTGGVLLGQTASVTLLIWLGWQTALLRRSTDAIAPELPQALLNSPLGPFIQRFRSAPAPTEEMPDPSSAPEATTATPTIATPAPATSPQAPQPDVDTADNAAITPDDSVDMVESTDSADALESIAEAATEDTAESQTSETAVTHPSAASAAPESPDGASSQATVAEPEPIPALSESELSETQLSEPQQAPDLAPVAVLPAVPPQDLSGVPEPAVISDLQELGDLAALEPDSPAAEPLESIADIDPLDGELWGSAKTPATQTPAAPNPVPQTPEPKAPDTPKQPEPPQPTAAPAEEPSASETTFVPPKKSASNTLEAEVSTSFADRIVEADFNPEEEDIVDVDVISSSPPQDKD